MARSLVIRLREKSGALFQVARKFPEGFIREKWTEAANQVVEDADCAEPYEARRVALETVAYYAAALVGVPGVVPPKGTESMSQTEIRARLLNALLEVPEIPEEPDAS